MDFVRERIEASMALREGLLDEAPRIARIADRLVEVLKEGGTVFCCGNGGSAADASHLAAELSGRFYHDRAPLAAVSLASNIAALTAIGNDYGFDYVFARQIEGMGRKGDALWALSTSGTSPNVVSALESARGRGLLTIAFTGERGAGLGEVVDECLVVPSADTPRIQEAHMLAGHIVCERIEQRMFG